ncbi:MAG: type II toxin-antitoxin system VapC family toxin [Nitrospinae bacterium]|nr:type II toxin-antitoxin system VapC family toxin [Nitrospinota bacterium]
MKVLLDTCAFIWIVTGSNALSKHARAVFSDPGNEVYLSAVSIWEMGIKRALGRLESTGDFAVSIMEQRELHGIQPLPLEEGSAASLPKLPLIHNDPFDRMLICQALTHGMAILTPDKEISKYPARVVW